ncbi:hypothetical protein P0082_01215 [Candidatus Haliotispira prima]|uniref:Uncharacterized protein n=1 Tax=Candidatus Haliotispira prima TaxID=3034016 RepID=A0ABY8MHK8_9SPIO|nr:hypothetical protein P0082_01215 [Candidatus Haliotispira prima]
MLACAPLPDAGDSPPKSTVSLATTAVVSSVQLEMSSTLAITNIGAVIRLAAEAAPTKAEAEAREGYVSLEITAGSPCKFSISQHYGTNFTDGFTLADVLTANTQYKLYLFFDPNAINSIEGATLANGVATLSFTTATLPAAGDPVWARSLAEIQFVGSLPEWSYSQNQKGVFVVYAQLSNPLNSLTLTNVNADNIILHSIGTFSIGLATPGPLFLFGFAKLGGNYPDTGAYYYVIGADKTGQFSGKDFDLETANFSKIIHHRVPLNRY